MTGTTPAPVAASCARGRRWRFASHALLVALLAPLLSLVMVFTTGQQAFADSIIVIDKPPPRVKINPVTKAVPGTVLRASPVGRVLNLVGAGMMLYDLGSAMLDSNDNPAAEGTQAPGVQRGTAQCTHVVIAMSRTGSNNQSAVVTIGSTGTQGAQSGNCDSFTLTLPTTRTCTLGTSSTTITSNVQWSDNPAGTATTTKDLCAGGVLTQLAIDSPPAGPTEGEKFVGMVKDFPIPDELYLGRTIVHCTKIGGTGFNLTLELKGYPGVIAAPSCYSADPASYADSMVVQGGVIGGTARDQGSVILQPDYLEKYPDCFDALGGMKCTLRVWVGDDPCTVGDPICIDWEHQADNHPQLIKCKWGAYTVALANCHPLRNVYKTGSTTATGVDPNGEPIPDPSPTPTTETTIPKSGKNWDPLLPPGPENQPPPVVDPTTDPDTPSCWGEGWSWNPVSWVYVPVKCAMLWTFKPPPGYLDSKIQATKDDLGETTPGLWAAQVDSLRPTMPGGSCGGIPIDAGFGDTGTGVHEHLGAACSGSMADTAALVKMCLTAVVIVAGALACMKYPLAAFGIQAFGNGGAVYGNGKIGGIW